MNSLDWRTLQDVFAQTIPDPRAGVEVGVHCGDLSGQFLRRYPRLHLTMVDAWEAYPPKHPYRMSDDKHGRWSQGEQRTHQRIAEESTRWAAHRRRVVRGCSSSAAAGWKGGPLDFVFLDDDHTKKGVWKSLAWWKHVRPGGLLCGGEFANAKCWRKTWGIVEALTEFSERERVPLFNRNSFWWIQRPAAPVTAQLNEGNDIQCSPSTLESKP